MALPDVEKTPILLIRFTSAASARLIDLVEQRLRKGGLLFLAPSTTQAASSTQQEVPPNYPHHDKVEHNRTIRVTTTQQALEVEAERIHLIKQTFDTKVIDYFTRAQRQRFCDPSNSPSRDAQGLFTANEWSLLTHRILDRITVLLRDEKTSELSKLLETEYKIDCQIHFETDSSSHIPNDGALKRQLRDHGERSACLRHVLETYDLVDVVTPVHLPALRDDIVQRTWWPWYQLEPPIDTILDYYGWEVAFYFAWMGFLTKWLLFPGVLGLVVYLLRWYRNDTIDEDEYTPFYGLVTFLWGVLFLRFWDRQESRLAYKWGTYSLSPYERKKYFAVRPEFIGYLRRSPVTGHVETYYPTFRRRLKYVGSAVVTVVMLAVAFTVMIISLNLQGYIRPQSNPNRWDEDNPHPFYFQAVSILAEEGQLFDAASQWRCYLPVVLHIVCISTLNYIYRLIAEKLTAWENHETTVNHRNSLILKRFLFEAFDCWVALFYLAFYERDIERLRLELIAVFQIDSVRRVLLECIVPMLLQRQWSSARAGPRKGIGAKDDDTAHDADKDVYEQFDDYMEILIQLGYVTLFASAYPLASLVSIAANWVEIRADCFKLAVLFQRPVVYRSSGLGMWKTLMASVIWMSALTNCLLFGFTSDQMMHYVPDFYTRDKEGFTLLTHEKGWIVVFCIFGLERLLIVSGLLIYAIVPAVPEDVSDELERRQYIRTQEYEQTSQRDKKED
jgi:anoctamin-10